MHLCIYTYKFIFTYNMKDTKTQKRLVFNITTEDEKLLTRFQLMKLEKTGEKPSYNEVINEVAGFSVEKLRALLNEFVEKNK